MHSFNSAVSISDYMWLTKTFKMHFDCLENTSGQINSEWLNATEKLHLKTDGGTGESTKIGTYVCTWLVHRLRLLSQT